MCLHLLPARFLYSSPCELCCKDSNFAPGDCKAIGCKWSCSDVPLSCPRDMGVAQVYTFVVI